MRSSLAASSLAAAAAPGGPHPPAQSGTLPPRPPGPRVPPTALRGCPSPWSGAGRGPRSVLAPSPLTLTGPAHPRVPLPANAGETPPRPPPCPPSWEWTSVLVPEALRPEVRAPTGGLDFPREPPGLVSPAARREGAPRVPLRGDPDARRARARAGARWHLPPRRPPLPALDPGALWAGLALPRSPEPLRLIVPGTWEPPG